MDFTQLKDIPFQYILAGIAVFYIKLDKDREKYYRETIEKKDNQSKEDRTSFLNSLSELSFNQKETKEDIKELKIEVKNISDELKRGQK